MLAEPFRAVLLSAIRAELHDGVRAAPATGSWRDADWRRLFDGADWHRLTGVLARAFTETEVPRWVATELARVELRDTARGLLLGRTREDVLDGLAAAAIPALLLKGSALVETVYPAASWRDMGDIDLLVAPEAHAAACMALGEREYTPTAGPEHDVAADPGGRHDAALYGPDGLVPIELHRRPLDDVDARFDVAELWQRALPRADGIHLLPAPHDLLIHLCLHFVAGRGVRSEGALGQVRDIAWVAARAGVDWESLVAVSERFGVTGRVQLALAVTEQLGLLADRRGLLPSADAASVRRFVVGRVLTDRPQLPLGSFRLREGGLRELVWWSRRHLSDLPAGELAEDLELRRRVIIGRGTGLWRAGRLVVRAPGPAVAEVRLGRFLKTLR